METILFTRPVIVNYSYMGVKAELKFTSPDDFTFNVKTHIPRGEYYSVLNNISGVLEDWIEVDGYQCQLLEFIKANMVDPDVTTVMEIDLQQIIDLKAGESIFIGIVEVKKL